MHGLVLVFGGLVLVGATLVVSPFIIAVALFVLAPAVWVFHRRRKPVINFGPPVLMMGLLFLLLNSSDETWFDWVGGFEVAVFVGICGVLQLIFAPWLARQNAKIL